MDDPETEHPLDEGPLPHFTTSALLSLGVGVLGAIAFMFLFPGGSITTAMHDIMDLPGPGAGVGLVFGPFIILVCLLVRRMTGVAGAALLAASGFALAHSLIAPAVYGDVKTVGTLGSMPAKVGTVVMMGITLELTLLIMSRFHRVTTYLLSGILANLVLMLLYWSWVFPSTPKGTVLVSDVPILLGVTVAGSVVFGGILSLVLEQLFSKKNRAFGKTD